MPKIKSENASSGPMMGTQLINLNRCPHCSIADPNLIRVWGSNGVMPRTDGGPQKWWGSYACLSCGGIVTAKGSHAGSEFADLEFFPAAKAAHEDLPQELALRACHCAVSSDSQNAAKESLMDVAAGLALLGQATSIVKNLRDIEKGFDVAALKVQMADLYGTLADVNPLRREGSNTR
jgi:hypothetical protein